MTTTLTPEAPEREPGLDRTDIRPRPLPGRPLWVIFGSLLLIGAVGWGTYNVVELIAHEEWTERYTVSAEGLSGLTIDNDNGSVTVTGTDGDEVQVVAEVSRGLFNTELSNDVVNGTLEYKSSCPPVNNFWCRVTYTVEAPRDLDVVVNIDNGRVTVGGVAGSVTVGSDNGRVELESISGPVQVDTDNGRVELESISGRVEVDTDNGRVVGTDLAATVVDVETGNGRVDLEFAEPPDRVTGITGNGRLEVALPPVDGAYDVQTTTGNGSRDVLIATNPGSSRQVRLETGNGSITVRPTGDR